MRANNFDFYQQLLYYGEYDSTTNSSEYHCSVQPKFDPIATNDYLSEFRMRYKLERFFDKNESCMVNNLLSWTHEILMQSSYVENTINYSTSIDLIETSKQQKKRLNCYCHAYVLRDALQSFNIRVRMVYCLPINCDYLGNHVVVEYYSAQENSWILLDPMYNLFLTDCAGHKLNLFTFRQHLIGNIPIKIIDNNRFKHIVSTTKQNSTKHIDYITMMLPLMVVLQYEDIAKDRIHEYRLIPKRYLLPNASMTDGNTTYTSNYTLFYQCEGAKTYV